MSIASEIVWGELPQELEDSFVVTDGQLGELDNASIDFLTNSSVSISESLEEYGFVKNLRVNYPKIALEGLFFVVNFEKKTQGSFSVISVNMIGQAGANIGGTFNQRRLREISAYGQMVSVGPIEKVIIVEEETEGIDPETGNPAVVKRRVPKVDALGEVEYQNIVVTGSGTSKRWNINDPTVSVTDTYFVRTQPLTNVIGTALTPPTPPLPPPYKWTGYNEPLRGNAPSGWVLDDRRISVIIPNQIWRVVDTFNFYQAAVPD